MDNKKLLKFLYKDIDEIEELVTEKGAEGFDEFEIEFIQSRFKGAKQLIQILSEKENKQLKKIRPRPAVKEQEEEEVLEVKPKVEEPAKPVSTQLSADEKESLEELSKFEEELKQEEVSRGDENVEPVVATEEIEETPMPEPAAEEVVEASMPQIEEEPVLKKEPELEAVSEEQNKEQQIDEANHRLGDSFSKDKSVNELLGKDDSQKLEYKISNSPVESINASIGINDRYQYIRELFDGSADKFNKAVEDLDGLSNIQEAVSYLQQNHSWKKNDISLKFVNLVKRRFLNG